MWESGFKAMSMCLSSKSFSCPHFLLLTPPASSALWCSMSLCPACLWILQFFTPISLEEKSPIPSLFPVASRLVGCWVCSKFSCILSTEWFGFLSDGWFCHQHKWAHSWIIITTITNACTYYMLGTYWLMFTLEQPCRSPTGLAVLTTTPLHLNLALAGLPRLSHGVDSLLCRVHGWTPAGPLLLAANTSLARHSCLTPKHVVSIPWDSCPQLLLLLKINTPQICLNNLLTRLQTEY